MAKGYTTAQPQYVQDFIYQPPWELMQMSLAQNQAGYDSALTQTQALEGLLNIAHRNSESDTNAAKEIKQYYETKINDLSSQINQDPSNWRKSAGALRNLTREIQTDRSTGNIAKLEGTYSAYQKYIKDAEELRKKKPEAFDNTAYQYGLNYLDKQWGGDSINNGVWKGEELISRPELLNAKNVMEIATKIPAYKNASIVEAPNGGYIITQGGKSETVPREVLLNAVGSAMMSDPTLQPYLEQQQRFGIPGANYFEEVNGQRKLIDPYTITYYDPQGRAYTSEEMQALPAEEKSKLHTSIDYAENPLGNILRFGTSFAYNNTEKEFKVKEDTKRTHDLNRQAQMDRLVAGKNMDMAKLVKEYELKGELNKEKIKLELTQLALEGDTDAQNKLNTIFAKESFGFIPVTPTTYNRNLELVKAGDPDAVNKEQLSRDFARKQLNYKPGSEESMFLQTMDRDIRNGIPREAAVKQFLENKFKKDYAHLNMGSYQGTMESIWGTAFTQQQDKFSKILEKYEEAKAGYFDKNASSKGQTELQPVNLVTGSSLTQTINSNPDSYYTTDAKGNVVDGENLKKILSVTHAFGANPKEKVGLNVIFEDNTQGYVFPKSSRAGNIQTTTVKNMILDDGLVEKQAGLYKELADERILDLQTQIESTYADDNGIKKVLYKIPGGPDIPIHKIGNVYYVVNPNDPTKRTPYNNIKDIIDLIY